MSRRKGVVIFVHGIGVHEAGWATAGEGAPAEVLKKSGLKFPAVFPNEASYDSSIEVLEITYDKIFETVRKQWNNLRNSLSAAKLGTASDSSKKFVDDALEGFTNSIGKVSEGEKFAATHALDAVLYKGSSVVRNLVRHSVASQLAKIVADRVKGNLDTDPTFTIVAHSLGTAVVHDALHLLARGSWISYVRKMNETSLKDGEDVPTIDTDSASEMKDLDKVLKGNAFGPSSSWEWSGLVMISNVSNLLCRNPSPSSAKSFVCPPYGNTKRSRIMRMYVNIDHTFDPVAKLKPFSVVNTFPRSHEEGYAEDKVELRHFYDLNIHGLGHYLLHPSVHSRIFALAINDRDRIRDYWTFTENADGQVSRGEFPQVPIGHIRQDLREKLETELDKQAKVEGRPTADTYSLRLRDYARLLMELVQ